MRLAGYQEDKGRLIGQTGISWFLIDIYDQRTFKEICFSEVKVHYLLY